MNDSLSRKNGKLVFHSGVVYKLSREIFWSFPMDDYLLLFVVIVIVVSFFGSQNVIIFTRVIWNHMLEGPQTVSSRQDRTVPFKATLARSPKCLISVSYQNIRKFHQNIMKFTSKYYEISSKYHEIHIRTEWYRSKRG